jgi:hypothetical protein
VPPDAGVVGKGNWEPILDEDQWRAVAALLTDPSRTTSPGNAPKWLGSLIYLCGVCAAQGAVQTVSVRGGNASHESAYACRGPVAHLRRSARRVDEFVADVAVARLSQPDARELFTRPQEPGVDRAALSSELNALRERANQLAGHFAEGVITSAQLAAGSVKFNSRIKDIEVRLSRQQQRSPLDGLPLGTDRVRGVWENLSLGSQRAIVRLLMEVTLLPGVPGRYPGGRYFDGSSVLIEWRS